MTQTTEEGPKPPLCRRRGEGPSKITSKAYDPILFQGIEALLTDVIPKDKMRHIFLLILPQLITNEAKTAPELYKGLPQDATAELASVNALKHHLTALTTIEILQREDLKYALTQRALTHVGPLIAILQSSEYKKMLDLYFESFLTLLCTIARGTQGIATDLTDAQIFTLARALIQAGMQLAEAELQEYGILRQRCDGCFHPFEEDAPDV